MEGNLRDALLTVHILAIVIWIGFGFCALWIGRLFLASAGGAAEAPLIRFLCRVDIVIFAATLIAFAAGIALVHVTGWGWFTTPWLGLKQAIMLGVLGVVAMIFGRAKRLGDLAAALPPGEGSATPEMRRLYRAVAPWYLAMRIGAVAALVLAVWKPA